MNIILRLDLNFLINLIFGGIMKISIISTSYVGLVTGVCLADFGNNIICAGNDKEKKYSK